MNSSRFAALLAVLVCLYTINAQDCSLHVGQQLRTKWVDGNGVISSLYDGVVRNTGSSSVSAAAFSTDASLVNVWELTDNGDGEFSLPSWRLHNGIPSNAVHQFGYIIQGDDPATFTVTSCTPLGEEAQAPVASEEEPTDEAPIESSGSGEEWSEETSEETPVDEGEPVESEEYSEGGDESTPVEEGEQPVESEEAPVEEGEQPVEEEPASEEPSWEETPAESEEQPEAVPDAVADEASSYNSGYSSGKSSSKSGKSSSKSSSKSGSKSGKSGSKSGKTGSKSSKTTAAPKPRTTAAPAPVTTKKPATTTTRAPSSGSKTTTTKAPSSGSKATTAPSSGSKVTANPSNAGGTICPAGSWWSPAPGTTWQWQLTGTIDTTLDVQMYDIDLFDATTTLINKLHASGKVVICYFSTQYEDWRPDASQFPSSVLGNNLDDWAGEKYVDSRSTTVRNIMAARLDLAASKGCDGVEPDNVDSYSANTGFPLTTADGLSYNQFMANSAHQRSLSVGLKNDLAQVKNLVGYFDWALNEQCNQYSECSDLTPFITAGKAVFNCEYSGSGSTVCAAVNKLSFSSLIKDLSLGAAIKAQCCTYQSGGCAHAAFTCVSNNRKRSEDADEIIQEPFEPARVTGKTRVAVRGVKAQTFRESVQSNSAATLTFSSLFLLSLAFIGMML